MFIAGLEATFYFDSDNEVSVSVGTLLRLGPFLAFPMCFPRRKKLNKRI